jgi:hydroxypyruvate isomerase
LKPPLRIAANISMLFRELPLLERFEAARRSGFDAVEMQSPYGETVQALARAAEGAALRAVLINAPVLAPAHPFGIAGRAELQGVFCSHLPQIAEYAAALGAKCVHVLAGRVDSAAERETCLRVYEENLLRAAQYLRPHGIRVLIEPLNAADAPGYLLGSFDLAREVLARCGDAVGLQFDVYHATRMGLDLLGELDRARPLVRHMQFADAPGRHEPGTGNVPFEALVKALLDARYEGWIGAEYLPLRSTEESLGWLPVWRAWSR